MCHLTKDIVEGIATGFLQIQPAAVSALILDIDADEDHSYMVDVDIALPDGDVSFAPS